MKAVKVINSLLLCVVWAQATTPLRLQNAESPQSTSTDSNGLQRSRRQNYYSQGTALRDNDILDQIRTATATDLGSSYSFGAQFSQGYIDLGSRNPVDEGAASLAFVFDTTGSMSDDMKQVIEGAGKILNTILEKFDRPIHNYVFVPFHDPSKFLARVSVLTLSIVVGLTLFIFNYAPK